MDFIDFLSPKLFWWKRNYDSIYLFVSNRLYKKKMQKIKPDENVDYFNSLVVAMRKPNS